MKTILKDKIIITTSFSYLIVMFFFLWKYDINLGGEGIKYPIKGKQFLLGDDFKHGFFDYLYVSYILLSAFVQKLSINFIWISVFQIFLSLSAALLFYKMLLKYFDRLIALIGFFLLLSCYPVQRWVLYLYSEGVHTSFVIIGLYTFISLKEKITKQNLFFFISILVLLFTTRPIAIIFLLSCAFLNTYLLYINKKKVFFYVSILVAFILILVTISSPIRFFVNPDSIKRQEIICQVPEVNKDIPYKDFNSIGLGEALRVIKQDVGFGNYILLGLKKVFSFFKMQRSYFSSLNNLVLSSYYIIYLMAIIGLFIKEKKYKVLKLFSILYILISIFCIFFTCSDWSNRFISPVFPFIILLAIIGIDFLVKKRKSNLSSTIIN
jgi:4-amino-4-deoxy-L-arabinose transferase-like glycosyltransferase